MTSASTKSPARSGGKIFFALLSLLVAVGIYASYLRFSRGLGATTNLSDAVPWGLWIWFTLTRVALSAGGFVICAIFYVFRAEKFHAVTRAAVLTAFIGYGLVGLELIYDLGLPLHFWHPLIYWNWHSPMLETSWCIGLYFGVLGLEMSIPFTEGLGWKTFSSLLKNFCVAFAIAGATLSTLHQSSIGTIFLISDGKLSPLWFSSWLPLLFFASALAGGTGFLILELFLAQKFLAWEFPKNLVQTFGRLLLGMLGFYLLLWLADFTRAHKWGLLADDWRASAWLALEMLPGVLLPLILLGFRKVRESAFGVRLCALLAVFGLFLNRLNVTVVGFILESHARYFPSWQEFAITLMILSIGLIFFIAAARRLPIFSAPPR
jgi:Ni/Fe-hydrogenase subunit HybB-like protein